MIEQLADDPVRERLLGEIDRHSFHLAMEETPTLFELLESIASSLDPNTPLKTVHVDQLPDLGVFYLPTADCGPLSLEKSRAVLGWKPTSFRSAVEQTSKFFTSQAQDFEESEKVQQSFETDMRKYRCLEDSQ